MSTAPPLLSPARVAAVLRELEWPVDDASERWLSRVASGSRAVEDVPGHRPTWRVGVHEITVFDRGDLPGPRNLICSCPGRVRCLHVGAVLLELALRDPERRALIDAPLWELALAPLATPLAPPTPAEHDGHVQYELLPPDAEGRLRIAARVVRIAKAEDRTLSPARMPRDAERLKTMLRGLGVDDLARHEAFWAVSRARDLERRGDRSLSDRLTLELVQRLSGCPTVGFEGRSVAIDESPLRPRLTADRDAAGDLVLRWDPPVAVTWTEGVVLTVAGTVQPLHPAVPTATRLRLADPLPTVPAADIERFVDRMVVERGLAIELPADIARLRAPDARVARLVLTEDGDSLQIRLDLAYRRGEGEAVTTPADPNPTVAVPGAGLVVRDRGWEREQTERFTADLGAAPPHSLRGPAAIAFLRESLPELEQRWEIWGQDGLVRHRVLGTLAPQIGFRSGVDWFDLDVTFEVAGRKVPLVPVIRSWLAGERLHRLDDGSLAELPERWLDRHGRALDELADVRRAQKRLGSWHAWMAAELLDEVGEAARPWLQWTEPLRSFEGIPQRPPPPGLQATLRGYQQRGFEWLAFLRDAGLHGVLADDMGLGKTLQALAVVLDSPRAGPSLVVAPTSVVPSWADETARFAPDLTVQVHHGPKRGETFDGADLVITSYGLLRRDRAALVKTPWQWVILDEAQAIKNPASLVARAARALPARHRLAMTGTPIENHLIELWSLLSFCMPGYLGSRRSFHARYAAPVAKDGDAAALGALRTRLRPFVLRRTKDQVTPELPTRTEVNVPVTLSERERRLYDRVWTTYRASARGEISEDGLKSKALHVLDALTRLRQACCHPALLPFPEARGLVRSSKVEALLERLVPAVQAGHKALVFSQWPSLLHRVGERLDHLGISRLLLEGATRDRGTLVRTFQQPDGPPVFLISVKAGGTGLTLTAADLVFHLDPWWNPAAEAQATDRAHRIGQTRPVTVYRLVATNTIEERVLALQKQKRKLFEQTLDTDRLDPATLSLADLEAVLGA